MAPKLKTGPKRAKLKTKQHLRRGHVHYTHGPKPTPVGLRTVHQLGFPELLQWSETKAKQFLVANGVLPAPSVTDRRCYACTSPLVKKNSFWECSGHRDCRFRLTRPALAFWSRNWSLITSCRCVEKKRPR